jgi:hypothetical protein
MRARDRPPAGAASYSCQKRRHWPRATASRTWRERQEGAGRRREGRMGGWGQSGVAPDTYRQRVPGKSGARDSTHEQGGRAWRGRTGGAGR